MNNQFNEREAILFEMQDLKEQSRKDFDFYFEMRKYRNQRYNELQDRLRDLDEIQFNREKSVDLDSLYPSIIKEKPFTPKSQDMTPLELELERVEKPSERGFVPLEKLVPAIEDFLESNGSSQLNQIQAHMEAKFGTHWTNFNTTLKHAMKRTKHIGVDKTNKRRFLYFYY